MEIKNKLCYRCNKSKPVEMFTGSKTKVGSYSFSSQSSNLCKACNAAQARQWRRENPGYTSSGKIKAIPKDDRLLASAISSRLTDAKSRARKRGRPETTVSRNYLYQLFLDQDRRCAITGIQLRIKKRDFACLSLDQIVPELGYIEGNVQWVAWAVNRAKGDMPMATFINMCERVLEYQKVQRLSKGTESNDQ